MRGAVQRSSHLRAVAPFYGWLTWLKRDGRLFDDASRSSWCMFGAGGHMVWIDPDDEAVSVHTGSTGAFGGLRAPRSSGAKELVAARSVRSA